jgi:hypothetical protein
MIRKGVIVGHPAVWIENDCLSIIVLPEKGADIYQITEKGSGINFLMQTPQGLRPPDKQPASDFLDNYEGGWQELFPNPGDEVEYKGEKLPFHGEVALLPWKYSIQQDSEIDVALSFSVLTRQTPFELERVIRLEYGNPSFEIEGKVSNLSKEAEYFLWGHHVVLGGDFLEDGCRVELAGGTIRTPDELYETETAKLAPGQNSIWPVAEGREPGELINLAEIPGPEARHHDDVFISDLKEGKVAVLNPRLGVKFLLEWNVDVYGCLVNWRPLGGADLPPLTGIYGLGIEPWVSWLSLTEAIARNQALRLSPGATLSTKLKVSILKESSG